MHADLEAALSYTFHRAELLNQALTHRSYSAQHNERLEFIGDAALNCVIALALYQQFPNLPEGDLSRLRANLVNRHFLYQHAQRLQLRSYIKLGEGELRSGGAERPSIISDALEAVFGAILLDGGFTAAQSVIQGLYASDLARIDPRELDKDPKTRLQEFLQGQRYALPEYKVVQISGEAHRQTFEVSCLIAALDINCVGKGASRRAAEQEAAAAAYQIAVQLNKGHF